MWSNDIGGWRMAGAKGARYYRGTSSTENGRVAHLEDVLWGMPRWRQARFEQDFWQRVAKPDVGDGCWLWLGARSRGGYGLVQVNRQRFQAHRLVLLLRDGTLRMDRYVLHRCDVPGCVNPDHLYSGTAMDNVRDMVERGRAKFFGGACGRAGEKHPNRKLHEADVREIRRRVSEGHTFLHIARDIGVSASTVSNVAHFRTWRTVGDCDQLLVA